MPNNVYADRNPKNLATLSITNTSHYKISKKKVETSSPIARKLQPYEEIGEKRKKSSGIFLKSWRESDDV